MVNQIQFYDDEGTKKVLFDSNKVAFHEDCCCGPSCDDCPADDGVSYYYLDDYNMATPASPFTAANTGDCTGAGDCDQGLAWDGRWDGDGLGAEGGDCTIYDTPLGAADCVILDDGTTMDNSFSNVHVLGMADEDGGTADEGITTSEGCMHYVFLAGDGEWLWTGEKAYDGGDRTGTYTRTGGCSTLATIGVSSA